MPTAPPETLFRSSGLVSPSPSPVVTNLPHPIDLPYYTPWTGVRQAIKDATDTIMNSPLNPYKKAQLDAEMAKNKVIQDAWKRKLAEGTAGYATEKFGPGGVETYGVNTANKPAIYQQTPPATTQNPPTQNKPNQPNANIDQGRLTTIVQKRFASPGDTITAQQNSDGSYTFSDQNGHVVKSLSSSDAQTLLRQNPNSTTNPEPKPTVSPAPKSTSTVGQHSGYASNDSSPPGVNDFMQYLQQNPQYQDQLA